MGASRDCVVAVVPTKKDCTVEWGEDMSIHGIRDDASKDSRQECMFHLEGSTLSNSQISTMMHTHAMYRCT